MQKLVLPGTQALEELIIVQIGEPDCIALGLLGIGYADTASGGADGIAALGVFLLILLLVAGQDQVGAI